MNGAPSLGDERDRLVSALRAAGCVFAEDEAKLLAEAARDAAELERMLAARVGGRPLELVLGWAEFCGLRIKVAPGVFVPRRRTEFLARRAARLARPGDVVVDLCCGAGALGAALASILRDRGGIELHAADLDPAAVRCARENLERELREGTAFVYEGDLDAPLPPGLAGRVSVLTANVPYVPSSEIPLLPAEARDYEPLLALDGGDDGLDLARRVASAAARLLKPGGSVLMEISERQEDAALAAIRAAGLEPEIVGSDEYYTTVLAGRARSERG